MKRSDLIPAGVREFIEQHIDDVPQLETVLMMCEAQEKSWEISEVAARNYISPERAAGTLEALRRRGLVTQEGDAYRFRPMTAELSNTVAEVGTYYRAHLARIATFIHSKPAAAITEFARAFDLKKDR